MKTYTLQSLLLIDRLPVPCRLTHFSSKTAEPEVCEYVFHLRFTQQNQQRGEQAICNRMATAITEPSIFYPCQTILPVSSKPLNQRRNRGDAEHTHLTTKSSAFFLYVLVSLHYFFVKCFFSTEGNKLPWPTQTRYWARANAHVKVTVILLSKDSYQKGIVTGRQCKHYFCSNL